MRFHPVESDPMQLDKEFQVVEYSTVPCVLLSGVEARFELVFSKIRRNSNTSW